jgi:type I restriction enzyme M protein
MEEACTALLYGQEQESILRIYTILQQELHGDKLDTGLYPTPLSLARFMVAIAQPEPGETIYDPACGIGTFFIEACRYIVAHDGTISNTFLGYDINPHLLKICKKWMEANGIDISHIRERDRLTPDLPDNNEDDSNLFKGKYLILTHPPYELIAYQPEKKDRQSKGPIHYYDIACVHHCMEILRKYPTGRCGVIVPQAFFSNRGNNSRKLRYQLVNEFNLRLLVRLPEHLFATAEKDVNYHSYLLYFDKQGITSMILRCNIGEDETPVPSRSRQFSDGASFKEAENIWKQWREQSSPVEGQKYAWILDAKTEAERDKDFRLIDTIPFREEEASPPLDEIMQQLVEQSGELYKRAQQLQKRIKEGM